MRGENWLIDQFTGVSIRFVNLRCLIYAQPRRAVRCSAIAPDMTWLTPRLKIAIAAAALGLLVSLAIVPHVDGWHHLCRVPWFPDSARPGRVIRTLICVPIQWFYIAAALGCFLASLCSIKSIEGFRTSSLLFFLLWCDFFCMAIGGIAYNVYLSPLPQETLGHDVPQGVTWWLELLPEGVFSGLFFGNLATAGFGFLIGFPTVIGLPLWRVLFSSRTA